MCLRLIKERKQRKEKEKKEKKTRRIMYKYSFKNEVKKKEKAEEETNIKDIGCEVE